MQIHKIAVVQIFSTHSYSRFFIVQTKLSHLRVSTQSEQIQELEKNVLETMQLLSVSTIYLK